MLTNLSTTHEVIQFFEMWLLRQNLIASDDEYQKACDLINDDVDFWANTSMWNLYNKAKE